MDEGKFRADLYYRLNVVPMRVPSLRERRDDIVPLINHFLDEINKKYKLDKAFSNAAYRLLKKYDWPGNVRELKNLVWRAAVTSDGDLIEAEDLPMYQEQSRPEDAPMEGVSLREYMEEVEYHYIKTAYERYGSVRSAAAALKILPSTFIRKKTAYDKKFQK